MDPVHEYLKRLEMVRSMEDTPERDAILDEMDPIWCSMTDEQIRAVEEANSAQEGNLVS